jgi:hypothetical protein
MIGTKKLKRKYDYDDKTDLDIKTSINKIGEIINLSQELNTYLWDDLNHGAKLDDLMPLYNIISQLSVQSGCEIDAAKREIPFDNYAEMVNIKERYIRHDEKGRMILPYFFTFSHKLKGYYDGVKKNYKHHDTAMDYLEEVIDEYRIHGEKCKNLKFKDLINYPDYSSKKVQYRKIQSFIDIVRRAKKEFMQIATNNGLDRWGKWYLYIKIINELTEEINILSLNEDTLYWFLKDIENDDFSDIRNILLLFLFNAGDKSLYNIIRSSKEHLDTIKECPEGDILIFGRKYGKNKEN